MRNVWDRYICRQDTDCSLVGANQGSGTTNRYGAAIWGEETALQLDGGDGCTALTVDVNATEFYTLKLVKIVSFLSILLN